MKKIIIGFSIVILSMLPSAQAKSMSKNEALKVLMGRLGTSSAQTADFDKAEIPKSFQKKFKDRLSKAAQAQKMAGQCDADSKKMIQDIDSERLFLIGFKDRISGKVFPGAIALQKQFNKSSKSRQDKLRAQRNNKSKITKRELASVEAQLDVVRDSYNYGKDSLALFEKTKSALDQRKKSVLQGCKAGDNVAKILKNKGDKKENRVIAKAGSKKKANKAIAKAHKKSANKAVAKAQPKKAAKKVIAKAKPAKKKAVEKQIAKEDAIPQPPVESAVEPGETNVAQAQKAEAPQPVVAEPVQPVQAHQQDMLADSNRLPASNPAVEEQEVAHEPIQDLPDGDAI